MSYSTGQAPLRQTHPHRLRVRENGLPLSARGYYMCYVTLVENDYNHTTMGILHYIKSAMGKGKSQPYSEDSWGYNQQLVFRLVAIWEE